MQFCTISAENYGEMAEFSGSILTARYQQLYLRELSTLVKVYEIAKKVHCNVRLQKFKGIIYKLPTPESCRKLPYTIKKLMVKS